MSGNNSGALKAIGYALIIFSISALIASVTNFMLDMTVITAYVSDPDAESRTRMIAYLLLIAGMLIGLYQFYCGLMAVMQSKQTPHFIFAIALLIALIGYFALCFYQASTLIVMIITGLSICGSVLYVIIARKYSAYLKSREAFEDD